MRIIYPSRPISVSELHMYFSVIEVQRFCELYVAYTLCIGEVTVRRARLILRWLTVRWFTVPVCNRLLRPTQPYILSGMENE